MKCEICGKNARQLRGGLFGIPLHCNNPSCEKEVEKIEKEYYEEVEKLTSAPVEITNVKSMKDWNKIVFAVAGVIIRGAEKDEVDLGINRMPQLLVQRLNEVVLWHIPREYYGEEEIKGQLRTADGKFWFTKEVPAEVILRAFQKAGILKKELEV